MGKSFEIEWDYYMQGFRLHQRMTRAANSQAQVMFAGAIETARKKGRDIPRARGILAFTQLSALLNDWIGDTACADMLSAARKDKEMLKGFAEQGETPLASAAEAIDSLTGKEPVAQIANAVITYYAASAVALDPSDFDNHWSLGTALLYARDFGGAFKSYKTAAGLTAEAPDISRDSLDVDRADALFYRAPFAKEGDPVPDDVKQAITMARKAIDDATATAADDSKRHRWNWTLGWAYYEANEFSQSLTALLQIQKPHDLINKNIIASYVGLGKPELAIPIARDFLDRNPRYTLAIEDRWPYQDTKRRDRWKAHLRAGGLPD
jgi:tetratricopeptide (TPR) repeat protein